MAEISLIIIAIEQEGETAGEGKRCWHLKALQQQTPFTH
jgi:hypothetical protein